MSYKKLYIDTETTNDDPTNAGLISIAAVLEVDDKIVDKIVDKCKPFEYSVINEESLKIQNLTVEDIAKYEDAHVVYKKFINFLGKHINKYDRSDKAVLCAYNAQFDDTVMRKWFLNNGDNYYGSWFYFPYSCIMQEAMSFIDKKQERHLLENFKLFTVCEYFDIKVDTTKTHDALYDIVLTKLLKSKIDQSLHKWYSSLN